MKVINLEVTPSEALSDEQIIEKFIDFLLNFTTIDDEGKSFYKYREEILHILADETRRSIVIDFPDLALFDQELADYLLKMPIKIVSLFDTGFRRSLKIFQEDLSDEILRKYRVRIKNIGKPISIRLLHRAENLGRIINFRGIVVKATKVKPILRRAMFRCQVCGFIFPMEFEDEFQKPTACPNPTCDNNNPNRFEMLKDSLEYEEYQELTIQELPEELPPGQLPQSVVTVVRGDLTNKVRPGDRVTVYGVVKTFPERGLRVGKKPLFDIMIETLYIDNESSELEEIELTEEEKEIIESLKDSKDLEQKIYQSIAPSIYGYDHIKKAIAALLFGGVPKVLPDGTKIRGTINVLLIGDPGTGKSQILKYVAQISPRALYTSGRGASAAGLTAAVVKSDDGWALEAGVLVLADKGIACLHPDSRVFVDGKFMKIKDLFDPRRAYKAVSRGEIVDIQEEEHNVTSLNFRDIKIVNRKATVIRRKWWDGKLLKIRFRSGNELIVTPDHLLVDGETFEWKQAIEFKEGDLVVAPLKLPSVKEKIFILDILPSEWRVKLSKEEKDELKREVLKRFKNLSEFNKFYEISRDFLSGKSSITVGKFRKVLKDFGIYEKWRNRPLTYGPYTRREKLKVSYITPELAYFLGFLYGDGWIQKNGSRVKVSISQSKNNTKQIRMIRKIFLKFYPKKLSEHERVTESLIKGKNVRSHNIIFTVNSPLLAFLYDYLTRNNLENAFKLDDEALKGFIAGALDSDGCVSIKKSAKGIVAHVEFLLSKDIKNDRAFAMLLRRFNVFARVIKGDSVNKIRITGREDVKLLLEAVKDYSVKVKKIPLRKHLVPSARDKVLVKPVKHVTNKIIEQVPSAVLIKKGIWSVVYSLSNERSSPNRLQLTKMLERISDDVTQDVKKDLEILASRDYFLDEIVSIKYVPYKGYVYDIYVPKEHNFVAEGVIVHNCIDEFDKMSRDDRRALHEAMEQQSISIAKAGIVATLNARTSILAAANPKFGRYLPGRDLADNLDLPPTILSRFDLIFVLVDIPKKEEDYQKASHILGLHTRDVRPEPPFSPEFLKKYILYAREHVFPKLTKKAANKILDFYMRMRAMSKEESEENFGASPIAITARQLEALVRLTEAHARMLLKDEADEQDADFAIELMRFSLSQVGRDPQSGKIDIGIVSTGVSSSKRAKYLIVMDILRELENEYPDGVPLKRIIEVAKEKKISEDFVVDVLNREKNKGNVYEPRPGKYKSVSY